MSVKPSTPRVRVVLGKTVASAALFGQLVVSGGCGSPKQAVAPPSASQLAEPGQQLAAPPIENVQAPLTHVERADVDAAIEAGVGRFIQGFDMVEHLDEYDRFVGWRIGKVHDRQKFEGLGIGPGDVVTTINGLPLERPAQVYEVLMSLKTAQSIDIEYLRGGRVMRLSLPILRDSESDGDAHDGAGSQPAAASKSDSQKGGQRATKGARGKEPASSVDEKKKLEE